MPVLAPLPFSTTFVPPERVGVPDPLDKMQIYFLAPDIVRLFASKPAGLVFPSSVTFLWFASDQRTVKPLMIAF